MGRATIEQICKNDLSNHGHRNPTEIVGIADSQHVLFDPRGLDTELLSRTSSKREEVKNLMKERGEKYGALEELVEMVIRSGLDGEVIFVDATSATHAAMTFHKKVLQGSNYLVTANKNPVGLFTMADFNQLTQSRRYNFNTTVMAGAGAIHFSMSREAIRDRILEIEGMLSGTVGYIFSELGKDGVSFSQAVRSAQEKGFTEPNPYDDLNGLDVARKLLILCRSAGYEAEFNDIKVEPLIGESFKALQGEAFWEALSKEDGRFSDLVQQAKENNAVLRFTAKMELRAGEPIGTEQCSVPMGSVPMGSPAPALSVRLRSYPKNSPFDHLTGTQNLVCFQTKSIASHIIESPGAGLEITANSLRDGIARMLPHSSKRF